MTKLTSITKALSTDSQLHGTAQRSQSASGTSVPTSAEDPAQEQASISGIDAADGAALAHKAADRDFQSAMRQARAGKDDFSSIVKEQADGTHLPAIPSANALFNCTVSLATQKSEQGTLADGNGEADVERG